LNKKRRSHNITKNCHRAALHEWEAILLLIT